MDHTIDIGAYRFRSIKVFDELILLNRKLFQFPEGKPSVNLAY